MPTFSYPGDLYKITAVFFRPRDKEVKEIKRELYYR